MKILLFLLLVTNQFAGTSQNPQGFDKMCDRYIKGTVPLALPSELNAAKNKGTSIVILDAREEVEYKTSHIAGAKFIGYKKFELDNIQDINKNAEIYIYCSIGYRSEKIGEKLLKAGYQNVYNLYGGIFNWANNGLPLEGDKTETTKRVHGYNKKWSKWLNTDQTIPVTKKIVSQQAEKRF